MKLHYLLVMFQKIFQLIMKKTELYGYGYDFVVDYDSIDCDDILDIHKYLLKKQDIK